ncbi:MAG: hypothetical protein KatS3mg009_0184 [Acidimicrobiia bacterium]|nr:MAG: hypothetical protein KatS3mg009_0184 [Acidimicrobiia bacterium]
MAHLFDTDDEPGGAAEAPGADERAGGASTSAPEAAVAVEDAATGDDASDTTAPRSPRPATRAVPPRSTPRTSVTPSCSRSRRCPSPSRARTTGRAAGTSCTPTSGYENKVKSNLASRVRSMNVEDRIFEVVIPMEDVVEFKGGRKVVVQKKVFPGYLLVRMSLDDDAWYVVRNTPGVTGFVGSGARPTPLSRKEVEDILGTGEKAEGPAAEKKVRPRLEYEVGEHGAGQVTGPFADFNGLISEIDVDRRSSRCS